ncbi:hypothetical protein [Blastopirellula marina]|uniref:VWFA domain-containing protein n=1 Tax=Blastopirellula marina TaxID=124 RepID=A0A2S8F6H0_9BACT|nr:hypothetical protein [Blastopirellula marina]PQO27759.1 hypothetical protein C5Y98_27080 [Blastopirellula marina]PTL41499.1 hypothetical protein C5Y97_27095 [Blastopirellula marina]
MNDAWRQFVRWALADDNPATDSTMEVTLQWAPPWAAWVTLVIVIGAIAFFGWIYRRENYQRAIPKWAGLLLGRLILVGIVLFMLYGLQQQPFQTDAPDLVIALDDSQSMSHLDTMPPEEESLIRTRVEAANFGEPTRWNQARTLLLENNEKLLYELRQRYNVRTYWMGESGRALSVPDDQFSDLLRTTDPQGQVSRLGTSLSQILEQQRGRPTAAIVMLSDGITIEGPSLTEGAQQASLRGIPIFPIGIGSQQLTRELKIEEVVVDPVAFVGDMLTFVVRLSAQGMPGETVTISVADKQDPSRTLDVKSITLPQQQVTREIRLQFRPEEIGEFDFQVEAETGTPDPSEDPNLVIRKVKVLDATIKVLYVQAYPRFQFRFLKMLLERQLKRSPTSGRDEKAFALTTILQDADQSYADQDETAQVAFPATRQELFDYDVVIIGDINSAFLSREQLQNLQDFVEIKGGGLMFVAGQFFLPWDYRSTPLEALFPFSLDEVRKSDSDQAYVDPVRVNLTELGLNTLPLQVTSLPADTIAAWRSMSQVYWNVPIERLKPGAQDLADADRPDGSQQPLLTQQFIGRGKVMFLGTDDLWRWDYHDEFWMQSIRYLARSSLLDSDGAVEITVDRSTYRTGESATVRVRFFDESQAPPEDDGVQLTLEKPDGRTRTITMSRVAGNRDLFEATIPGLTTGEHRLWIVQPLLRGKTGETKPPSTEFTVEPVAGEMTRLDMDLAELKQTATITRGKYFSFLEADSLLDVLPKGRQVRIQTLPPEPLWNSWKLAFLFVTLLIGEWVLRKRMGLV